MTRQLRIVCSPDGCRIERRAGIWPWRRWVPHEEPYSYMGHRFRLEFPDRQSAIAYLHHDPQDP